MKKEGYDSPPISPYNKVLNETQEFFMLCVEEKKFRAYDNREGRRFMNKVVRISILWVGFLSLWLIPEGISCTLFGAIGKSVEGGGVLIGRTRDRPENLEQVFIEVIPPKGYRYQGISTKGKSIVTSGINERGLVVVSAAASSVERREKKATPVGKILSEASSVDEVIRLVQKDEIIGPIYFLIADIQQIALFELFEGGRNEFVVKREGILHHTNHFILERMERYNSKTGRSSSVRLNRIEQLLTGGPFRKDDFISFARDHEHGPGNHSICRHFEAGSRSSEKTISAAVYYLPPGLPPEVWVVLGQPCESQFEKY